MRIATSTAWVAASIAVAVGAPSTPAVAQVDDDRLSRPIALDFEGNLVLPNEVYTSVLELAATATGTVTPTLDQTARFVESQLTTFLRKSGYLLAIVTAAKNDRGGLTVEIDEGRLDRILVVGQGVVRALQLKLLLDLPEDVFNRFTLERQLAELVRDRGLVEARYQVVPMEQVDHPGIQVTPSDLLLGDDQAVSPGSPHELRISLEQGEWRTGFGQGIGFQSPDGFFVSASYRGASTFIDDDRWFSEIQVAVRSFEALFSVNSNVGVSRVESINRWYAPPIINETFRPTVELDLRLQSRFRGDLGIDSYFFSPLSASLNLSIDVVRGFELVLGGGLQFRNLFDVEARPDTVLEVRTEESTIRAFGGIEATWNFEPEGLRLDRQDTLRVSGQLFSGSGGSFGEFSRILGDYDLMIPNGYDEVWVEVDGALLLGDVPFYDEVALGDGFVRVGYTGDFFSRMVASVSAEYRLSLIRDTLKVSVFNDAALFDQLDADRTSDRLQFMDSVGLGLHVLVFNVFQVNVYGGAGFVPRLAPLPGVSVQVKQAF